MTSSASGSSTTIPHAGQYHRASSTPPHTSWRYGSPPAARAPQSASSRSAPASSRPDSDSSYAKRGGRSEDGGGTTSACSASSFSRALSTLGAIPSSSSCSSLKRFGPSSKAATTSSVH